MFYFVSPTGNYFNAHFYKNNYNIPLNSFEELLNHYVTIGHKMGYDPSLYFENDWYRNNYDLDIDTCPLVHFTQKKFGKFLPNSKCDYIIEHNFIDLKNFTSIKNDYVLCNNQPRRINIVLPGFGLSAGPLTAYTLAQILRKKGYNVRIIFQYSESVQKKTFIDKVIDNISKRISDWNRSIEFVSLSDDNVLLSENDIFIATAWWTVYPLQFILGYLKNKNFFWLVQENELVLHSCNTTYAQALETYNLDYTALINTSILFDDLKAIKLGSFGNKNFLEKKCICFEPAFDKNLFFYEEHKNSKIRIIFYSRTDSVAERNLGNLLVSLLSVLVQNFVITADKFEIIGFGELTEDIHLGYGVIVKNIGFVNNKDQYAHLIRSADILLSFQLAPHPSYPPLEIAHCNGVCLHTNFSNKTKTTISRYTDKIIMSEPNLPSLINGFNECLEKIKIGNLRSSPKLLNENWEIALQPSVEAIENQWKAL